MSKLHDSFPKVRIHPLLCREIRSLRKTCGYTTSFNGFVDSLLRKAILIERTDQRNLASMSRR